MPLTVMLQGLGLGLSLILPIGAQNAFVLRQGIRRQHVLAVVAVCAASDVVLIAAGVSGAGAIFTRFPEWLVAAKWAGAAFLLTYAFFAARRALKPGTLVVEEAGGAAVVSNPASASAGAGAEADSRAGVGPADVPAAGRAVVAGTTSVPGTTPVPAGTARLWPVVATALALTWLNPHVYLDTVVLLGSLASTHGDEAWAFGVGAGVASILWFSVLGAGSRLLAPLFARPIAWRIVDGSIAVVMTVIALNLVLH